MDLRDKKIDKLILEINHLLENETSSLIPLVTKAASLANLCDDAEHRRLFDLHLDGVDPNETSGGRIQKWPDKNQKPRWDVAEALLQDRRPPQDRDQSGERVSGHSLQQLEYIRDSLKSDIDSLESQGRSGETIKHRTLEYEIATILGRIRNRVGTFIRITEAALLQEQQKEQQNANKELRIMSSPPGKKIFIGHGGKSRLWRELKDFISERLQLPYDEFNRTPSAGKSTKERLEEMLNESCFAFLIMTAEDEHADQTVHARENVIHEIGLFQGRLGFSKAIVLLEDGCSEFSNIHGITQLRFPEENILANSEELRQVLEREGILPAEKHSR